jgi:hypothetical protein
VLPSFVGKVLPSFVGKVLPSFVGKVLPSFVDTRTRHMTSDARAVDSAGGAVAAAGFHGQAGLEEIAVGGGAVEREPGAVGRSVAARLTRLQRSGTELRF